LSSAVRLSLSSFDDGVRQAYARLFPGDPDKSLEMLDWRFQRNPHGPARFAVAVADDIVVALIALVPTRLRSVAGQLLAYPYNAPFQAGQPVTVTSTCNATSTWLAQSTNAPANPPSQRGERGR
jgi:hypothetical protein